MALPMDPVRDITLGALLPQQAAGLADILVQGLQVDSRLLHSGDVFLAMPGEIHDGRDYLAAAGPASVAAIVAETGLTDMQRAAAGSVSLLEVDGLSAQLGAIAARFYNYPSAAMHVIGVTGTNGKTTTSRLLAQLLRHQFNACGVIGTLGATLADDVVDAANTTPDALSLQAQLGQWLSEDVTHAVLEVSSHSLVQGRVNALEFNTAVFTNLTHDHLDYHGDMDSYGLAKSRLFRARELGAAILNLDDPYAETLQSLLDPAIKVIGYSVTGKPASVSARDIRYHHGGLEANVETPWGTGLLCSPLAGDFNLSNLLAALSAACVAGVPFEKVLSVAPTLQGVAGRMEYIANERGLQLVVDYAHTPDALQQALSALRSHVAGELICVFGCGGDRDADKRPLMGRIAAENSDRVIVTSDNPRGESPLEIIEDIKRGISGPVEIEPDRAAAIALAVARAAPGDCVLIAGKGHEPYQQIGTQRLPFSDADQLRLAVTAGGAA
jgi:UDP-N-acetylmuramoyl-L-alanyl-D-glutamate--2,6-diaminopimelate ligase